MNENTALQREIETIFRDITGRECVYVPSARVGIYAVLRSLFSPGERVLITPVTDDVVLFVLLAAGVRPVMAPISVADGNIDVEAVPDSTWSSLRGVVTSNLYGMPDRVVEVRQRCREYGLKLIEDVAHALHSQVEGIQIGSFGEAGIFSLSKHPEGVGGVVNVADTALGDEVRSLRDRVCGPRLPGTRVMDRLRPAIGAALARIHLRSAVISIKRSFGPGVRDGHRMPVRPELLRREIDGRSALSNWDPWVGFDLRDYRLAQNTDKLRRTVAWLRQRSQDRAARIEGVLKLRSHPALAGAVRQGEATALFRVPLLVVDREAAGRELEAAGHPFHYVYDPPLDDYAGSEFVDPSPSPEAARWWAHHAVPIDPRQATMLLRETLTRPPFEPATNPPGRGREHQATARAREEASGLPKAQLAQC